MWVKSNGGNLNDQNFYTSCIRQLFDISDADSLNSTVTEMCTRWSQAFNEYFSLCLESAVTVSSTFAARRHHASNLEMCGIDIR